MAQAEKAETLNGKKRLQVDFSPDEKRELRDLARGSGARTVAQFIHNLIKMYKCLNNLSENGMLTIKYSGIEVKVPWIF